MGHLLLVDDDPTLLLVLIRCSHTTGGVAVSRTGRECRIKFPNVPPEVVRLMSSCPIYLLP